MRNTSDKRRSQQSDENNPEFVGLTGLAITNLFQLQEEAWRFEEFMQMVGGRIKKFLHVTIQIFGTW